MQRKDIKKSGGYEANYNAGWVTTDESTAELAGTRAEVDVIVWALEYLVAEQNRLRSLRVTFSNPYEGKDGLYYSASHAEAEAVLQDIKQPNYPE